MAERDEGSCSMGPALSYSQDSKASLANFKNSLAVKVQAEEVNYLKTRMEAVQRHLQSMKLKPIGDLFSTSASSIECTLECVEHLIDHFSTHFEFKIANQKKIADLAIANRSLVKQLETAKMCNLDELNALKEKIKQLSQEKMDKMKQIMTQKGIIDSEKSIYETKARYMQNEIRKKELTIKSLSDKLSGAAGSKFGSKPTGSSFSVEVINEHSRGASKEHHGNLANSVLGGLNQSFLVAEDKLQNPNPAFITLRQENDELRQVLYSLHQMILRAIDRRKHLLLGTEGFNKDQVYRTEINDPLFNMSLKDMQTSVVKIIQKNFESLFGVIDSLDSVRSKYPKMRSLADKENIYSASKLNKSVLPEPEWDEDKQKMAESLRKFRLTNRILQMAGYAADETDQNGNLSQRISYKRCISRSTRRNAQRLRSYQLPYFDFGQH